MSFTRVGIYEEKLRIRDSGDLVFFRTSDSLSSTFRYRGRIRLEFGQFYVLFLLLYRRPFPLALSESTVDT